MARPLFPSSVCSESRGRWFRLGASPAFVFDHLPRLGSVAAVVRGSGWNVWMRSTFGSSRLGLVGFRTDGAMEVTLRENAIREVRCRTGDCPALMFLGEAGRGLSITLSAGSKGAVLLRGLVQKYGSQEEQSPPDPFTDTAWLDQFGGREPGDASALELDREGCLRGLLSAQAVAIEFEELRVGCLDREGPRFRLSDDAGRTAVFWDSRQVRVELAACHECPGFLHCPVALAGGAGILDVSPAGRREVQAAR